MMLRASLLTVFALLATASPENARGQLLRTLPSSSLPVNICATDSDGNIVPGAGRSIRVTSVAAVPSSGGHSHDDGNRPNGSFTITSGITQDNGCYPTTFNAPSIAGTYTVTTQTSDATNQSYINVGRFDLFHFRTNYTYTYFKTPNPEHPDPYYCTATCVSTTETIASEYTNSVLGATSLLELNDAALVNGGQLDLGPRYSAIVNGLSIPGKWWDIPHQAHKGLNVDIRYIQFYDASKPVGHQYDNRVIFYAIAVAAGANPYPESNHYHLRYTQ